MVAYITQKLVHVPLLACEEKHHGLRKASIN